MFKDQLGDWLEWQRRNGKIWFFAFLSFLALLLILNIFIHPVSHDAGHGEGHAVEASHAEAGDHGAAETHAADTHAEPAHAEEAHAEPAHAAPAGEGYGSDVVFPENVYPEVETHTQTFMEVDHPHFTYDVFPGFWLVFSFLMACIMTIVLKKGVFLLIGKSEDYYERD